jgi:hypothetical protein
MRTDSWDKSIRFAAEKEEEEEEEEAAEEEIPLAGAFSLLSLEQAMLSLEQAMGLSGSLNGGASFFGNDLLLFVLSVLFEVFGGLL